MANLHKIIINGRAGAGKDTVADYLVERHGYTKISFATYIYTIAYDLFKMEKKDRKLLQDIGQKMREVNPLVWVNWTFEESKKYDKVVIPDCRQANEYLTAVKYGFTPIRIKADYDLRLLRCAERDGAMPDTSLWENASENGADDFMYYEISNNSSVEQLYENLERTIFSMTGIPSGLFLDRPIQ